MLPSALTDCLAWRARWKADAAEPGLDHVAIRPHAIGQQGGTHLAAAAGFLPLVQRGDDAAIERHGGWVVAHPGNRAGGDRGMVGPHLVHQAGACPVGGGVETGLAGFVPSFTIGGERGVDQARICFAAKSV